MGMGSLKKDHWEKDLAQLKCVDSKYSKPGMGAVDELSESVNKLADYAKKNKVSR